MILNRKPIILIPGFGGSRLIDNQCAIKHMKKTVPKNEFININVFKREWGEKFRLKYDNNTGLSLNDSIDAYDFGGVEGIRNLCEDCVVIDGFFSQIFKTEVINSIYNYKYFDTFVRNCEQDGYKQGINLFGAPYDFRKIMFPDYLEDYFSKMRDLIENAYDITQSPSVLVAHSIGSLIMYIYLVEYCSNIWKQKYIDSFICVGGPFGGSSIAVKTLISGLPKLKFLKEKYHNVMVHSSGMMLALPNIWGYNSSETILYDSKNCKTYNVNNYHDILPSTSKDIWEQNVKPYIETFNKNTGVNTIMVYSANNKTECSYIYDLIDHTALKEPDRINTCLGDGVVPYKSLSFHSHHKLRFPNYSFYELDNADHTKILHGKELYELIDIISSSG